MANMELVKSDKVLSVALRIEVMISNDQGDQIYKSRIEDFDAERLIVAMPMDKGYPIIPLVGSIIHVKFATKQSAFKFVSVYLEKKMCPLPVWVITKPLEIEKYQRRSFVRVAATIPLKVQIEDAEKELSPVISAYSNDVSGGGLRIVMDQELKMGTRLYVQSNEIEMVGNLECWCEVVRSVRKVPDQKIYWIGTKFVDLPRSTQSNLIRFIFKRQRDLLVKAIPE